MSVPGKELERIIKEMVMQCLRRPTPEIKDNLKMGLGIIGLMGDNRVEIMEQVKGMHLATNKRIDNLIGMVDQLEKVLKLELAENIEELQSKIDGSTDRIDNATELIQASTQKVLTLFDKVAAIKEAAIREQSEIPEEMLDALIDRGMDMIDVPDEPDTLCIHSSCPFRIEEEKKPQEVVCLKFDCTHREHLD